MRYHLRWYFDSGAVSFPIAFFVSFNFNILKMKNAFFWPNIVNIESSTHFIVYSHTHRYVCAPWNRILLENLTGSQLVKKFPSFYGTRKFITVFTNACHLSLSWARSIQSVPSHPTSRRSVLRFCSHLRLGLPNGLFSSGFPNRRTQPVYIFKFCVRNKFRLDASYHLAFLFKNVQ